MTCMAYNILRMHRRYLMRLGCDELIEHLQVSTAVSSETWAKLRVWAGAACKGRLLLSGSVAHASLKTAVLILCVKGRVVNWL